jgi:hypothetical protein
LIVIGFAKFLLLGCSVVWRNPILGRSEPPIDLELESLDDAKPFLGSGLHATANPVIR